MSASVYVIATMDTKGAELAYVAETLRAAGIAVKMVDVGTMSPPTVTPDITREQVLAASSNGQRPMTDNDRGSAVRHMAEALRSYLVSEVAAGRVSGVLGLGGSGGTSLITTAMRALPIGLPKLMVSTVASGNVAPYVDCSDITMMYSVVDVAGLNVVSEVILGNAANAMAGMFQHALRSRSSRQALGMTMFGVTTPCVNRVRQQLESEGYDCLVFHATGAGGRAMEQLVASGMISGVLDITTTEVADEIVGGVFSCGPHRFEKLIQSRVPLVLSLGALDMVNFGAMETVPQQFRQRKLHVHNAQVTLMRTTPDENRQFAVWIANKLNQSTAPLRMLIPEGGVSLLDVPGQPFYDPEADAALFDELTKRLHVTNDRQLIRVPYDINAPEFSTALLQHFRELINQK
jgi:uncharacterized protein (UPF0261 family)